MATHEERQALLAKQLDDKSVEITQALYQIHDRLTELWNIRAKIDGSAEFPFFVEIHSLIDQAIAKAANYVPFTPSDYHRRVNIIRIR
jgi:hypothetical protein